MAINAGMGSGLGGRAFVGVSNAGGGYAIDCQAGDLKLRDGSTLPFTGSHEAMILKTEAPQEGDILCDKTCITTDVLNSFTEVELSQQPMQKEAVGVFYKNKSGWDIAAFVDREATATSRENAPDGEGYYEQYTVYKIDKSIYENDYNPIIMNSVGEGAINVCGEGGNISKGDLIVTSSTPGKGMKQADDIVRSYTVAKAREDVTFSNPTEVKMVACIYLCG